MTEAVKKGTSLPVMEMFYSVQGEGAYQGKAAYFVRLAGCDVGCVWCDVKDSWDASDHPVMEVTSIVDEIAKTPAEIVIVTGGEPLMYDLNVLSSSIKEIGLSTHIETSGAHPLTGSWDWVTFSPKRFKKPVEKFGYYADELKVIIFNKSDFAFAEEHGHTVNYLCDLYIQPEWGREEEMLPLMVEYVKEHPQWRISLQIHKYMEIR